MTSFKERLDPNNEVSLTPHFESACGFNLLKVTVLSTKPFIGFKLTQPAPPPYYEAVDEVVLDFMDAKVGLRDRQL